MNLFAQLKKELSTFFHSPLAYVLLTAALVINGIVFLVIVQFLSDPRSGHGAAMQLLFGGTAFFYLLNIAVASLITMRSLAEEAHTGTLETLLTAPISETRVVLAKFFAAVVFYAAVWAPTLAYVALLARHSDLDPGPIASGYLGTLGMGTMFLAVGIFFSAISRNQIISALLTFTATMGLFLVGAYEFVSPATAPDSFLRYVNLWTHMEEFGRGIVDTRHLIYYGSVSAAMLFAAVLALGARRWRG